MNNDFNEQLDDICAVLFTIACAIIWKPLGLIVLIWLLYQHRKGDNETKS